MLFYLKNNKIIKYRHVSLSIKQPFVIHANFETLLEKTDGCENNLVISFTIDVNKHVPYGFLISMKYAYDDNPISKHFHIEVLTSQKNFVLHQKNC